ncbi:hypothetical protein [Geomicrobium sp. JCM 19038]|uniref:hypothetical protein n=1 Tax=Geomicrobium sp. JCM 19038 TaxID=1460635 RepID=UPI00045F3EC4|nr:hypothetical protein [Geomicrobium sp. JCM 19038]GAK09609.1 hypothetical protein JCM19038_3453 [Geomicrobium sp. JCM 19038]
MSKTAEIDLSKDAVLIIKGGVMTTVTPKPHGVDEVIWRDGAVFDVNRQERVRINGQSEI